MGLKDVLYKIGKGFGEAAGTYNTVAIPRKTQPGPPGGPYPPTRPRPTGRPVPGIELEDEDEEDTGIPRQARPGQPGAPMNPRGPNMRMCICCIVMIVIFTIMSFLFSGVVPFK